MRLLLSVILILAAFFVGIYAIPHLLPNATDATRLAVAAFWFFTVTTVVWVRLNPAARKNAVRDSVLYIGIALAVVAVVVAIAIHDANRNISREFKNDWTVAVTAAAVVFGYAVRELWTFRRNWRLWAAMVGLVALHFAMLIPSFSRR
jgi:hypothetical protein